MIKLATIGLGNAGNQVAEHAKKEFGIEGLAINTSKDDISNVRSIDVICIGDEKGAGKDRNIARKFLKENISELLEKAELLKVVRENDVIFIPSSTGGGSGSALAPILTDIFSRYYPSKIFIPVGILPPLKESVAAQQNSLDYMKEILNMNPTYMLYDNEKRSKLTRSEMLLDVNREIAQDFAILRGDYQFTTPYTSIDDKDSVKIAETRGRLVVVKDSGFREKDLDEMSIEDRLIEALRNGVHAELDRDHIIKRAGLITNFSDKIYKTFDPHLPKFKALFGEPIEEFEHVFINKEDSAVNRAIIIMSGLSVPDDRIEKMIQRIDEVKALLTKTKESSVLDDADTDLISELRKTDSRKGDVNLDDIFNNYMKS